MRPFLTINHLSTFCLVCLAILSPSLQAESLPDSIKNCLTINSDQQRLACYDRLAKQLTSVAPVTSASENKALKADTQKPEPPRLSQAEAEATFGLDKLKGEVEQIETHIVGEFKGWVKGDVLTLANGQRWRVTSASKGYVKLKNPKIVISRGFFGSFNAKVEGLNAQAKVKRID